MKIIKFSVLAIALLSALAQTPAQAQVVFEDDFSGTGLDGNKSKFYGTAPGGTTFSVRKDRTLFDGVPSIVTEGPTNFVRVQLDTYHPQYQGTLFKGTEMFSRIGFGPAGVAPDNFVTSVVPSNLGFEFETRLRFTQSVSGTIGAFYLSTA